MMKDNSAHFFEGTEKLLEVWFSQQDEKKGTGDLRTIPRFVPFCACVWDNRPHAWPLLWLKKDADVRTINALVGLLYVVF